MGKPHFANGPNKKVPVTDRFKSAYRISESGCWEWCWAIGKGGYGRFPYNGNSRPAHRVSYELFVGPIPINMMVLHKCDNPPCVNPNHLFLGTNRDNINDMLSKGRSLSGEHHHQSKLKSNDVLSIRRLSKENNYKCKTLAKMFGVTSMTIWHIVKRKTWRYI